MLHQIELYRRIPELKSTIHGFIEETKIRLSGGVNFRVSQKYRVRLDRAEKAITALRALHESLDE